MFISCIIKLIVVFKKMNLLQLNDFIIVKEGPKEYSIKLTDNIETLILIHKEFKINDLWDDKKNIGYSSIEVDEKLLEKIKYHIKYLGNLKEDLLQFYKENGFTGRISDVNEKWFNSLVVMDFHMSIESYEIFKTYFIVYDYLQNNYGFHLELINQEIVDIEYDGNL